MRRLAVRKTSENPWGEGKRSGPGRKRRVRGNGKKVTPRRSARHPLAGLPVDAVLLSSEVCGTYLLLPGFCPFAHSSSVFQSGSSFDSNCLPPLWKALPPASGASGMNRRRLAAKLPGTTSLETVSKLRRDCSSVQDLAPGGRLSTPKAVLVFALPTQPRGWPSVFFQEIGSDSG